MWRLVRVSSIPLLSLLLSWPAIAQTVVPTRVRVRGINLNYIEQGIGEPLILLHGGQGDYRSWGPQLEAFSKHYRVISYSRRYHYPNNNPLRPNYHSAYTEADDLAAFINKLRPGPVHLVGTSIGALTALVLAVKHPEMVRSLVLAEPPIHRWAKDNPDGEALYREFMSSIWEPATAAFKAGDEDAAMRIFVDGFGGTGTFDNLSPKAREIALVNSRFFKAATSSSDPFPDVPKDKVRSLHVPVLIIMGENTTKIHKYVNAELGRVLPKAERATIPKAGHGSARENPRAFNEAVLAFLVNIRREPIALNHSLSKRGCLISLR